MAPIIKPPAILKAGRVIPKIENISLPAMANTEIITKATITDLKAIILRVVESQDWVKPMNNDAFAIGFIMAKKAMNTVIKCSEGLSIVLPNTLFVCEMSNN